MNKKQYALSISIACVAIGFGIWLILSGYHYTDTSIIHHSMHPAAPKHWLGSLGAHMAGLLLYFFGGFCSWIIGLLLMVTGGIWIHEFYTETPCATISMRSRLISLFAMIFSGTAVCAFVRTDWYRHVSPGGWCGYGIRSLLCLFLKPSLAIGFLSIALVISLVMAVGISPIKAFIKGLHISFVWTVRQCYWGIKGLYAWITRSKGPQVYDSLSWLVEDTVDPDCMQIEKQIAAYQKKAPEKAPEKVAENAPVDRSLEYTTATVLADDQSNVLHDDGIMQEGRYVLPPLDLFKKKAAKQSVPLKDQYEALARIVEEKLATFGIDGKVTAITIGPVVVVYEYEPAIYVKVSRIVALEDDLALALQAHSLRIIAPVPGTSIVRFEVSKREEDRDAVYFQPLFSMLNDQVTYKEKLMKCALPLIIGRGVRGEPVLLDLAVLPHLLVAGSTGSGKSVVIHSAIMGLLYTKTPQELGLIYIDPKQLEGSLYKTLPHMLFPPIVTAAQAVRSLHWAVLWMENRYSELAAAGVRDVYEMAKKTGKPVQRIVIIIDELADLMLVAGDEVERSLARLAQMGRAAGIHLIVATQRPSVDVITGVIKANFPARIALRVASKMDSRVIIDTYGAQGLLGKGDMLIMTTQGDCIRAHGSYVSQEEISTVVSWTSLQQQAQYRSFDEFEKVGAGHMDEIESEEDRQLYAQIKAYVAEQDEISISSLQRQFRIGFNRSARIVEQLEREGFIAHAQAGGKSRKVLR